MPLLAPTHRTPRRGHHLPAVHPLRQEERARPAVRVKELRLLRLENRAAGHGGAAGEASGGGGGLQEL